MLFISKNQITMISFKNVDTWLLVFDQIRRTYPYMRISFLTITNSHFWSISMTFCMEHQETNRGCGAYSLI